MRNKYRITGDGFALEPFDLSMINDDYLLWLRNDDVNRYLLKPNKEIQRLEAMNYCKELIESKIDLFFAIIIPPENEHIGNVRIGPIDHNSKVCKFSMMIGNTDYHGKGLGTKIVSECISFVFDDLKMHKFYLDVISANKAAIRTYEKNGLVEEGLLIKQIYLGDSYFDLKIMSIFNKKK